MSRRELTVSSSGAAALAPGMRARMEGVREVLPGLLLAGAVGLTAHLAAKLTLPYALAVGFEVPLAMLLGLILVNLGGAPEWAVPGVKLAVKYVLGFGIILLGLRANLELFAAIGSDAFWLVLIAIGGCVTFAVLAGRFLGVERRIAVLIGVGCSICGNSAIAATAPVVKANARQLSFAASTITIFGTCSVFLFPVVGHALDLDPLSFGLWAGTAVPDTAQTIAASAAYDTVGRDVATLVKLFRTVLLAPLLLFIVWGWSRFGGDTDASGKAARRGVRKAVPFFVVGFVVLALVRTARLVDPETVADVDVLTRACFVVALAGLGLQTRLTHIRGLGPRPFLLGLGTWGLLAGGSLALIMAFGLGPVRTHVAGGVDPRPLGAWSAVCAQGAPPQFTGAFVRLARGLPEQVGPPVACAERDEATGDTLQRTARGVARLRPRTGVVTFSNGERTWPVGRSGPPAAAPAELPRSGVRVLRLTGRVLATGIPGAGALSPVGTFHPGGPIHDKRGFAARTRSGEVLDSTRLLVASSSNFGAPVARADWATGAILSLATNPRAPLAVPADFASAGGQARALGGAAQLYTSQSPAFLNRLTNAKADTADMPGVSNPLGISVNNAFGRPWFANSPRAGGLGLGVESVLDPDGRPLEDAASESAGGVFAGAVTDRDPNPLRAVLRAGAVGNAFLGASPDASGRAVFAVATADGGLAQVHVEKGVDVLALPGTLAPLRPPARVGMVFNWVPDRFLYVSDPAKDAVLQLRLDDDFRTFKVVETRRLESPYFAAPVDIAPAVPEIANPAFSSNTTLAGGSDLYVANRGSGTIVRLRQDGEIRAVARIAVPGLGFVTAGMLNGIAVSPDARTIWVSLSSRRARNPELSGSVIQLPAFGAPTNT